MRSELPSLELDAVFEATEELAVVVKNSLTEIMTTYGYQIVQVRIGIVGEHVLLDGLLASFSLYRSLLWTIQYT
jgi:hypothetical protein